MKEAASRDTGHVNHINATEENTMKKYTIRRNNMRRNTIKTFAMCGLISLVILLVACQANQDNDGDHEMISSPIEVQFSTNPDSGLSVHQAVDLQVEVSQAGDLVDNAEEVRFEIWHEDDNEVDHDQLSDEQDHEQGNEQDTEEHGHGEQDHGQHGQGHGGNDHAMDNYETGHEMLDAEHVGEGKYVLSYTFEKTGTYYVMYHVTARGYHAMTTNELIVE